ncbi:MAG TPA: DUF1287 domain-containing protein [Bacillales bacterium]
MKKWMRIFTRGTLIVVVLIAAIGGYLYSFHGYHGETGADLDLDEDHVVNSLDGDVDGDGIGNLQDSDANGNEISNQKEIVMKAESLAGTLYDPLKGAFSNIGGRMGFIVCTDVPRIAYADAGLYFQQILTIDYRQNPDHYDTENGVNTPATDYFFRRVRNVYDFAKGNGFLIEKADQPKVGDVVFYSQYHATLVVGVYPNETYDEVEADPDLIFVKEHHRKKWRPRDVARILPKAR